MALLYAGLAAGVVSVVSPVTAVTAAVVPVVGGLLLGEAVGGSAAVGVLLGIGAVGMLSFAPGSVAVEHRPEDVRRAVLYALGAGSSFGAFFLLIDRTGAQAGLWPLLSARATSIPLMAVAALVLRASLRVPGGWGVRRLVVVAGALDMVANISFLVATREGSVGIVAVLVALAPAATLGLARVVLHERVRRLQAIGLAVGAAAVVLIALG
jgi:drug/metabolite transporter (DMT)-like permease